MNNTTSQTIEIPVADATPAQRAYVRLNRYTGKWVAVVSNPEYIAPVYDGFQGATEVW